MKAERDERRFFIPEVVQTSAMDCGPASLKCLLAGFGIEVSYARLREICHTDVDGTSISVMEQVANQLGLEAEEIILPADHVFLREAKALPAIAVVRLANGSTHFVVIWSRHGSMCQIMDPAAGRVWKRVDVAMRELYSHVAVVPATAWREWMESPEAANAITERLRAIGLSVAETTRLVEAATADPSWKSIAALDAAIRFVAALRKDKIVAGGGTGRLVSALTADPAHIPDDFWSVTAAEKQDDGDEHLRFRGAVLLRGVRRRDTPAAETHASDAIASALESEPPRPAQSLLRLLRDDGIFNVGLLGAIWLAQACGVTIEALLFRGLFGTSTNLLGRATRLEQLGGVIVFTILLILIGIPGSMSVLRYGRIIENRLRIALLRKLPLLGDRFFQSRLVADLVERSHSVNSLRLVPHLGAQVAGHFFELVLTAAGIIWLDPHVAPLVIIGCILIVTVPAVMQPMLLERDLRVRSHVGALARFYLDSMVGLAAIRAHSAERAMRSEQENRLTEWFRASRDLVRVSVSSEGLQLIIGTTVTVAVLLQHLMRSSDVGQSLLLVYWALLLPRIAVGLANAARQYPAHRNTWLRLLEPLGAPEMTPPMASAAAASDRSCSTRGLAVKMRDVEVAAGGHTILSKISLDVRPGEHVAIIGRSGAGKSSLVSILLGWHSPVSGEVFVDGERLDDTRLWQLRSETAWVDPTIQIWNRSLLDNIRYSIDHNTRLEMAAIVEQSDLVRVLETLPDGYRTPLGEGGGLVSGGEGQRVRLARAMSRAGARLVILDEPFRGLEAEKRHILLQRARELWKDATLFCITHDIGETESFSRAIVVDGGRIGEDGDPRQLIQQGGIYSHLAERERSAREALWNAPDWRRLRAEKGRLVERNQAVVPGARS